MISSLIYYLSEYRNPVKNKGQKIRNISKVILAVTPDFMFDFYMRVTKKIFTSWSDKDSKHICSLFGVAGYKTEVMPRSYLCIRDSRDAAGTKVPYVLWLIAGMVPWFFFSDALSGGTRALLDYSYLVKKVVFKIDILPIVKIVSAVFVHLFFLAFAVLLYTLYGYYPDVYTLQVLYYSICLFVLVMGISYLTSAVVVFFRDLNQVINIVLQVGVWVTPIMWNIDTMDISPVLKNLLKLNPLYYIVQGYRDAFIGKVAFFERWELTIYFWVVTIVFVVLGTHVFKKLRMHFADVL